MKKAKLSTVVSFVVSVRDSARRRGWIGESEIAAGLEIQTLATGLKSGSFQPLNIQYPFS